MLATKLKLVTAAVLLLGSLGVAYALSAGRAEDGAPNPRTAAPVGEKGRVPGNPDPPKGPPMKAERPDLVRGVVKEVNAESITLTGGERVLLDAKTEYLRETGFDAAPAKRTDVSKGMHVYMHTKKGPGEHPVARVVVIELLQPLPLKADEEKKDPAGDPKPAGDPDAVMRTMDGFRKKLPEPQGISEQNGTGVPDIDGVAHPDSHLAGIASRLGVKTRAECIVLMTYLKDPDPKIRRIAAFAIERVVKVYPSGMSSDDIQKVDSDGHRKLVKAFIAGIEKLPK